MSVGIAGFFILSDRPNLCGRHTVTIIPQDATLAPAIAANDDERDVCSCQGETSKHTDWFQRIEAGDNSNSFLKL